MSLHSIRAALQAVILRVPQSRICELLDLSPSEVSRKANGESGWTIDQLTAVFHNANVQIVTDTDVVISREELDALQTLAKKYLEKE